MGKYINIGNTEFESVRKDEYVDKSMLIAYVNSVLGSQSKFLCVSRARRFGKSLAAKMLCAYYDQSCDSHALFRDLKIANDPSYEKHLNKYPVIYLDVASCMTRRSLRGKNIVDVMNDELMDEIAQSYPEIDFTRDHDVIDRLYTAAKTLGKRFIIIIERLDASIVQNDTQNDTQGAQNDTHGDTQGKLKGKALDAWILAQIRKNPKVSTERLAQLSGRGIATIKRHTAAMPNIRFQGSGYSGVWIIIEQ